MALVQEFENQILNFVKDYLRLTIMQIYGLSPIICGVSGQIQSIMVLAICDINLFVYVELNFVI
jgi:hypothetical protein